MASCVHGYHVYGTWYGMVAMAHDGIELESVPLRAWSSFALCFKIVKNGHHTTTRTK